MAKKAVSVSIPSIKLERHKMYLRGIAPLIVHAFPEKARKQMLDKQMKNPVGGRDARDPYAEVESAKYILPDGRHGFPAVGFKAAAVTACTSISDITKVGARQAFQISGMEMQANGVLPGSVISTALVPLIAHAPSIREDIVRLSGVGRTAEVRYRPAYNVWGVELDVTLNTQIISYGQLCTMLDVAGHGVGVGEYRPDRDGDCGRFELLSGKDEFDNWRSSVGLDDKSFEEIRLAELKRIEGLGESE